METDVKLTKLASCAGCGAKVGAGTLSRMLEGFRTHSDPRLLVGYDKSDDASVYKITDDVAIVQTTDFFPPIVDDPFLYGQIAATNALSDVYAMGGEPKLALNIMCLADKMDDHTVREILRGGYDKAYEAGAIITGGHTIHGAEPIYGLAVTGFVHPEKVLTNSNAKPGDALILTKPLGVGIITTAAKAELVEEALRHGAQVVSLAVSDGVTLPQGLTPDVRCVTVPKDVMTSVSSMRTPQGMLAVCRMPDTALPEVLAGQRYVVLDGVQDPGNVGTVIRTADAFGCDGVILLAGCADPYSVKTLRSSMGAVFRVPVWCTDAASLHRRLRDAGLPLYGAALRDDTEDARALALRRCAIAIGSEGRGLTEQVLGLCDRTVRIPMAAHCESLNAAVAAAVLLWEAYR